MAECAPSIICHGTLWCAFIIRCLVRSSHANCFDRLVNGHISHWLVSLCILQLEQVEHTVWCFQYGPTTGALPVHTAFHARKLSLCTRTRDSVRTDQSASPENLFRTLSLSLSLSPARAQSTIQQAHESPSPFRSQRTESARQCANGRTVPGTGCTAFGSLPAL